MVAEKLIFQFSKLVKLSIHWTAVADYYVTFVVGRTFFVGSDIDLIYPYHNL